MKLKKMDASGIAHDVGLLLFVVLFAIAGVAYIVGSHADSPTLNVTTAANTSGTLQGPDLVELDDASQTLSNSGDTNVSANDQINSGSGVYKAVNVVQPGQTLAYRGIDTSGVGWNGTLKMVCYMLRIPYTNPNNNPQIFATLELENYNNYKTVKVGSLGAYDSYCFHDNITVGPSTLQGWSVKNVSPAGGPPVYVYQKTVHVQDK